jgi:hypothetical protein
VVLLAASASATGAVAQDSGLVITLASLGAPPIALKEKPGSDVREVALSLPADAGKPGSWYVVRLDAQAVFTPRASGKAILSVSVNDRAAAQIIYTGDGSGVVTVDSLGSLGGGSEDAAGRHALHFENYAVYASVRPGPARLTFALESLRGDVFESLLVEPTSGLAATAISPEQLSLRVPREVTGHVGRPVSIPYQLQRRGERPDRPVTIEATPVGSRIGSPPGDTGSRRHNGIGNGVKGTLTLVSAEPGVHQVRVLARGGYNDVGRVVLVTIRGGGSTSPVAPIAVGAGVVLVGGAALVRRRVRSHA